MKRNMILLTILAISVLVSSFVAADKKKKVIFFGDSITQAGVEKGGYIDLIGQALKSKGKAAEYELVGKGISGNKVPDLQARLEKDVLSQRPDLVFIYIGINDVWHSTHNPPNGTPVQQYEAGLRDIVAKIKATGAEVVVCTPTVIGEKKTGENRLDKLLKQYADISRKIARVEQVKVCDLQKAFAEHLKKNNPKNVAKGVLTTDEVHLNAKGNALVAKEMLTFL